MSVFRRIGSSLLMLILLLLGLPCAGLGAYGIYVVVADWHTSPIGKELIGAPLLLLLGGLLLKGAYDSFKRLRSV